MPNEKDGRERTPRWLKVPIIGIIAAFAFIFVHPFIAFGILAISFIGAGFVFYPTETVEWLHDTGAKLRLGELVDIVASIDFFALARGATFLIVGVVLFIGITTAVVVVFAGRMDLIDLADIEDVSNYDK